MPGNPASPLLWSVNGETPDRRSLPAWCLYTGQSEEAAQGWGWLDALHPADRETTRNAWQAAIHLPHPTTLVYRLQQAHGGYQAFKVLHVPLFNDEHQLQAWSVFFTAEPTNPPEIDENWELRLIYGMIFTQAIMGILCLSLDGAILRTNTHLCHLTGYTEKELLSMTIWQLSAPDDVHLHLQAMRESLPSDQSYPPFRIRYLRKDGGYIWARVTQFLVHQPSGEPYYFFYVIEDVSAQIQTEVERSELLARAQEARSEALARTLQLETAFESITDGVIVCDRNGRVVQSNTAVKRLLHLDSSPNFLDLPYQERIHVIKLFDEHGQLLTPEQWPISRLLRGENLSEDRTEDLRIQLHDGQESYVNASGSPMRDRDNHISGAVLVIHDVNERRLLENRIRKSFRILLALAEILVDIPKRHSETEFAEEIASGQWPRALPFRAAGEYLTALTCKMLEYQGVSISLIDPDTEILHMVAISGSTSEGRSGYYKKYAHNPLSDILDEGAIALLRTNEMVIRDLALHVSDSLTYPVLLAPMIVDGRLVGVLTMEKKEQYASYTSEEISLMKAIAKFILLVIERERIQREWVEAHSSEMELREANRRFDEFLSIASHELRTPLAGIKGNLQLALRRLKALRSNQLPETDMLLDKLAKMQEFLREAEDRVNVQNRMISDLLDVTRIQANKLELVIGPCDLNKIVCEAVKDQQYNMPERAITQEPPCGNKFIVVGDADRLSQVVHNYLSNALKYSPPDQPISVSMEQAENTIRVSVHDQGPGLTPEEQKRVWERFYRVKDIAAQGSSTPGLGLGLHICRTIIEAHHGQLGLESAPGQGSTFWFSLSLAQSGTSATKHPPSALPQHASGS